MSTSMGERFGEFYYKLTQLWILILILLLVSMDVLIGLGTSKSDIRPLIGVIEQISVGYIVIMLVGTAIIYWTRGDG